MIADHKTALAFAGVTLLGAGLFAASFGQPDNDSSRTEDGEAVAFEAPRGDQSDANETADTNAGGFESDEDTASDDDSYGWDEIDPLADQSGSPGAATDDGGGISYSDPAPDYDALREELDSSSAAEGKDVSAANDFADEDIYFDEGY
ncbi:MAG: hypothetical protein WBA51_15335 [Erythrobacter sp.]